MKGSSPLPFHLAFMAGIVFVCFSAFFKELFTERSEVSQMELIEPSTAK
jgi:hypothetical protein